MSGREVDVLIRLGLALVFGFVIGVDRESPGKPAGISTYSFVIGGSRSCRWRSTRTAPTSPPRS